MVLRIIPDSRILRTVRLAAHSLSFGDPAQIEWILVVPRYCAAVSLGGAPDVATERQPVSLQERNGLSVER